MERLLTFCKKDYFLDKLMRFLIFKHGAAMIIISIIIGTTSTLFLDYMIPAPNIISIVLVSAIISVIVWVIISLVLLSRDSKWFGDKYKKMYNKLNS